MATVSIPVNSGGWAVRGESSGSSILSGYSGNSIDTVANGTDKCVIAGGGSSGFENTIGASSSLAVIGGGYDNAIGATTSGLASGIPCGAHHSIDATHAVIVGGSYGTVNDFADYGAVVGGTQNTLGDGVTSLSGTYAVILGGNSNTAEGRNAVVLAGTNSTANGAYALVQGNSNDATADHALCMGKLLNATAAGAWALGNTDGVSSITNSTTHSWLSKFTNGYTFNGGNATFAGRLTGTGGLGIGTGRAVGGGAVSKSIADDGSDSWTFVNFAQNAYAATMLVSAGKSGGQLVDRTWWKVELAATTTAVTKTVTLLHDGSNGTFQTDADPFTVAVSTNDVTLTYAATNGSNSVAHEVAVSAILTSSATLTFS